MVSFNSWPLCSQEITPIPNELKVGCIPEPVRTFWVREKIHASVGIRTPNRTTCNLVTVRLCCLSSVDDPFGPNIFQNAVSITAGSPFYTRNGTFDSFGQKTSLHVQRVAVNPRING